MPRRGFFSRRLSTASVSSSASISTVETVLPTYSVEGPGLVEAASSIDCVDTSPDVAPNARVNTPHGPLRYSIPPQYSPASLKVEHQPNGISMQHIEHSFPMRGNKPWATLYTFSRDLGEPQPKGKFPRFWGGEVIAGTVDLDLKTPTTIQQISITLQGKISALSGEGDVIFLDHEVVLYHKDNGEPRPSSVPLQTLNLPRKTKFDGKLLPGSYQFPFSIPFPAQVDLDLFAALLPPGSVHTFPTRTAGAGASSPTSSPKKQRYSSLRPETTPRDYGNEKRRPYPSVPAMHRTTMATTWETPQSFKESGVSSAAFYELAVRFVLGRFTPDNRINAPITYIPAVIAQPASLKRQQAYENAALIPGPHSDPEGWISLPTTVLRGSLSGTVVRNVEIECSLYVAKPLSYARGSHIPLYLRLSSQDTGALSVLCNPKVPLVRLMRNLSHFALGDDTLHGCNDLLPGGADNSIFPAGGIVPNMIHTKDRRLNLSSKEVATAMWWVPSMKGTSQQTGVKWLEGELHLPGELKATNDCALFSIEYFIELLPLRSHEFRPELEEGAVGDPRNQVLASHCVQIATLHAPDTPIPVAFTEPPKMKNTKTPQEVDGASLEESLLEPYLVFQGSLLGLY